MNWSDDPSALAAHSPCKARLDFLQLLICRDESLMIHLRPLNSAEDDADVKGGTCGSHGVGLIRPSSIL